MRGSARWTSPGTGMVLVNFFGGNAVNVCSKFHAPFRESVVRPSGAAMMFAATISRLPVRMIFFMVVYFQ